MARLIVLPRVLGAVLPAVLLALAASPEVQLRAAERLNIEIREVGGLKRRGNPASGLLELPTALPSDTRFRLLADGKPHLAQFRPATQGKRANKWWLDTVAELEPNQTRTFVVEYGADVPPGPEPEGGHVLTETDESYVIANEPYIRWTIPRDLAGLVRSVDFPPAEHLRPDSPGLVVKDVHGAKHVLGGPGTKSHVNRNGRMAVGLTFEGGKEAFEGGTQAETLTGVTWRADLLFPSPVSWVEVSLEINDPQNRITAVGTELSLNLDPPTSDAPTLVDLGASSTVYTSLGDSDEFALLARPAVKIPGVADGGESAWMVLRGPANKMTPFAVPRRDGQTVARAEGWAHIMDRRRCLALAVDRFAEETYDRITTTGSGRVAIWRDIFPQSKEARQRRILLRYWLHFVHFPPQWSAGSSPQSMQTPPEIRVVP